MFVAALFALAACGSGSDTDTATPAASDTTAAASESGSGFPSFVAQTVDGSQLDFGSLEGQDTVLWFWAPW